METYPTLKNAEPALKDVHDGVINALPAVDHFVVMHASHNEDGSIIGPFPFSLIDGLLRIPAILPGQVLLCLGHRAKEFDMAAGKEIKPTVDINDSLARLWPLAAK